MKYVIAVSGGVDSVVLLDACTHNRLTELGLKSDILPARATFIVAHFDHGIRGDSHKDEVFVQRLAKDYGVTYEAGRAELGVGASEARARTVRYNFLRQCCKKYSAQLMTAHHQDDIIETVLINLIRGTGWRGLAPMSADHQGIPSASEEQPNIVRPLLNIDKAGILAYAKKYALSWREDSTNTDQTYLRNYIRHTLLPTLLASNPHVADQLLEISHKTGELKKKIATELQKIIASLTIQKDHKLELPRYFLIMSPQLVALEVLYSCIRTLQPGWHPERVVLQRLLHFAKTGQAGKRFEITGGLMVILSSKHIQFKKR